MWRNSKSVSKSQIKLFENSHWHNFYLFFPWLFILLLVVVSQVSRIQVELYFCSDFFWWHHALLYIILMTLWHLFVQTIANWYDHAKCIFKTKWGKLQSLLWQLRALRHLMSLWRGPQSASQGLSCFSCSHCCYYIALYILCEILKFILAVSDSLTCPFSVCKINVLKVFLKEHMWCMYHECPYDRRFSYKTCIFRIGRKPHCTCSCFFSSY